MLQMKNNTLAKFQKRWRREGCREKEKERGAKGSEVYDVYTSSVKANS